MKKVLHSPLFYISALFILSAAVLNMVNSELIQQLFPNRAPLLDSLFLITPQVMWTQYFTDIAVLVSPTILLILIVKKDREHFPYYLTAFAFGYLLRGFMILLNPIGGYFGNMHGYGLTNIMQHGMFPSGHTILVFVAFFISKGIADRTIRILLAASCVIEIVCLILSRGHYGIDIIGGILVAYFVCNELAKHKSSFRVS